MSQCRCSESVIRIVLFRLICKNLLYNLGSEANWRIFMLLFNNHFQSLMKWISMGRLDLSPPLFVRTGERSLDRGQEMTIPGAPQHRRAPSNGDGSLQEAHGGSF